MNNAINFRASNKQIRAWVDRHDLTRGLSGSDVDARAAFDDAQSLYLTEQAVLATQGTIANAAVLREDEPYGWEYQDGTFVKGAQRPDARHGWNPKHIEGAPQPSAQPSDTPVYDVEAEIGTLYDTFRTFPKGAIDMAARAIRRLAAPQVVQPSDTPIISIEQWTENYLPSEKQVSIAEQIAEATLRDPLDWPIPCDLTVGAGTIKKGCKLRTVLTRMKVLHDMAMKNSAPQVAQPSAESFQKRVQPWMMECFGAEISADRMERNHRFFEEATELIQANGMTRSEAHQLVDYTFNRPVGELMQESGGVLVTHAALCLASGIDMHECGEIELARIWTKVDKIRAKQAAKPKHSPLPEATPPTDQDGVKP